MTVISSPETIYPTFTTTIFPYYKTQKYISGLLDIKLATSESNDLSKLSSIP